MSHQQRLKIGRQLSKLILKTYGKSVLAIFIYGSTAKKLDRPYSDLEIDVIVHDRIKIKEKFYVYKGIVIHIGYRQESKFLEEAKNITSGWPIEADEYRNHIILFERNNWMKKLKKTVAENDKANNLEAICQAATELTECLCVLRNSYLKQDERNIRARGLYTASMTANLVLLLNRRYVITTSQFWKQSTECPWQPPNFETLIETAAGFIPVTTKQIIEASEQLYKEVIEMVKSKGISIELDKLIV